MQDKRKRLMAERVVRDLEEAFPPLEPGRQKYIVESDKYSFYLYDSRPKDDGKWTKTPVAKVSFMNSDHLWQLSWMPPQGRWQKYGRYYDVETVVLIIKRDPVGCFLGENSPLSYIKYEEKPEAEADAKPDAKIDAKEEN
jgi:hypothetical protein